MANENRQVIKYQKVIENIPELCKYPDVAVKKFLRLFGDFRLPDRLHKNEVRYLNKLSKKLDKLEEKKEKRRERDGGKKQQFRVKNIKKMNDSNCKQRIVIDLSFFNENLMKYSDKRSCSGQIKRCYSTNRVLPEPVQFHITGVEDMASEILNNLYGDEYKRWDIDWHKNSYLDIFDKKEIVYLTSDSENVVEILDDSKIYIIGGLLDHNSLKGLTLKRAIEQNIAHARLPIDKYFDMKSLKVLTINQVFSVLASVANNIPWEKALIENIPRRKEAVLKKEAT